MENNANNSYTSAAVIVSLIGIIIGLVFFSPRGALILSPIPTLAPRLGDVGASVGSPRLTERVTPPPLLPTPTLTIRQIAFNEYKELENGLSIFNPPIQMMVGEPEIIAYRIGAGQNITAPT